jgi:hypothetical protein
VGTVALSRDAHLSGDEAIASVRHQTCVTRRFGVTNRARKERSLGARFFGRVVVQKG